LIKLKRGAEFMSDKIIVKIDSDLEEIIPMFIDNRHKDLKELDEHLVSNDIQSIEVIAHKLAGNAGSYGFMDLSKVGASLEEACKEKNQEDIKKYILEYKDFMKNLEVVFE
tara:strand:+ start:31917 stop:32249 length:333 start_codon:yes stop_codon:yes gene_type:complete